MNIVEYDKILTELKNDLAPCPETISDIMEQLAEMKIYDPEVRALTDKLCAMTQELIEEMAYMVAEIDRLKGERHA